MPIPPGRLLRGPKLAPSLSPAKTWSGAAGGLVIAMLVGQVVAGHVTLATAVIAAALLALACQAGDLLESGIKRHVGVKDSGNLIPGHGGLLDRLDGLLAAAPTAALVVLASGESNFLALDQRSVSVLGSTGSIGTSTVDLLCWPIRSGSACGPWRAGATWRCWRSRRGR